MLQQGTSRKVLVAILAVLVTVLIGVSIFIAVRLQQNQAPTDSSADGTCTWVETTCGGGCLEFFLTQPACCTRDSFWHERGVPLCTTDNPPQGCSMQYAGNSFRLVGNNCNNVTISKSSTSFSGGETLCPVDENRQEIGKGSDGATYWANPAPGECVQIDADGESTNGGVCDCEPPVETPSLTLASSCPAGSQTPVATITWGYGTYASQNVRVDISSTSNFATYWSKNVNAGITTTDATGFTSNTLGNFSLQSGTIYYVRVTFLTSNVTSNVVTLNTATCTIDAPPPTITSVCPAGAINPIATITWTKQAQNIDFDDNNSFAGGFWYKDISNVTSNFSTTTESGFSPVQGETQQLVLNNNQTYYVRINYGNNALSNTVSFNAAACQVVAAQCVDLVENGSEPIASGVGNVIEYTLVYQNASATNPYPNIKLRVGSQSSPVGRDATNTSSTLVDDYNYTHDAVTNRHTYRFRWEAASTAGVAVPAGTYDVRALLDGTTAITTPDACLETITVSQTVQSEPVFNVVKTSAVACEEDGDVRINYTVTATNIGSVTGVLDFVEDKYDANAAALNIAPTNINPTYGTVSNGKITWTGDTVARTYTAGQSKQFTYALTIPVSNVLTFTAPGVLNQARVQYDTSTTQDNTTTFDLRTVINCSIPSIPNTGIFDDARMLLLGMIFVVVGLIVYKSKFGYQLSEKVVDSVYDSLNERVDNVKQQINNIKPYEESIMDDLENKAKGKRKRNKNA